MRKIIALILSSFFFVVTHAAGSDEMRSFENENVGKVTLVAPSDWKPVERHHIYFGTTFYRLLPPLDRQFDFEIMVNDLAHMNMEALADEDLEIYIQSNMAHAAPRSIEGKVSTVRFGAKRDGVYARLTDKAPEPGEFLLLTQGVRLQGNRVVLFTLYSNDKDGSILQKALQIVESVQFEPTFAERVKRATEIETQKAASEYLDGSFFPALGSNMSGIMKMCLNREGASTEKFTMVANVSPDGGLIDIDFEPKANNTAVCFAREIGALKAPPPPLCDGGVLPIAINMEVKP